MSNNKPSPPMATVTLTLRDTPQGGVSIHSSFQPAIGAPCSAAQGHALEIMSRTHKQWGLEPSSNTTEPGKPEVDALLNSVKRQHPQWSWQDCENHADALRKASPRRFDE